MSMVLSVETLREIRREEVDAMWDRIKRENEWKREIEVEMREVVLERRMRYE